MSQETLLTTKQVAEMLQVSPCTVRQLSYRGRLQSIKLGYRSMRFRADAVADFVREAGRRVANA